MTAPPPAPAARVGPLDRLLVAAACLAAAAAPFWATPVPGAPSSVTVGALAILLLAAAGAAAGAGRGRPLPRPSPAGAVFLAACAALAGWAWVNAEVWGTYAGGTVRGAVEVLAVVLVAAAAGAVCAPEARRPLLLATCLTSVSAAVLALTDTGPGDATPGLPEISGRLEGSYGNPNGLAIALALGLPVLLAARRWVGGRWRIALAAAFALVAFALVCTFSRAGVLAAIAGCLAVVGAEQAGRLRRLPRRTLALGAVLAAAAGVGLWFAAEAFQEARERVNFAGQTQGVDRSGWDPTRHPPFVARGPADIRAAAGGGIAVTADAAGEGLSFPLGTVLPSLTYTVVVDARSTSAPAAAQAGLASPGAADAAKGRITSLTAAPRAVTARWRPSARRGNARLYLWLPTGTGAIEVTGARVEVRRPPDPAPVQTITIDTVLQGQIGTPADEEARFLRSREDALRLAVETTFDHPLRGLGLGRFVALADERLDYGPLAVHNEYLRVSAELGLTGLALLLAAAAGLAIATRRVRDRLARAAVAGVAVTAAVALVFADALATASLVLPLALAAGVAVGGWSTRGGRAHPPAQAPEQLSP